MFRAKCLAGIFTVLIFNLSSAYSEELSVDEAIQSALAQSPLVAEIDSNFAKEVREARDVDLLPNPELDAEMQYYSNGAPDATSNQPSLAITQAFRLSHLGLRAHVSKLKEQAAKQGKEAELVVFLQRVRLAFGRNWLLTERRNFTSGVLSKAKEISDFVEKGFKETIFGIGEREIFRAEVARLKAELEGLDAELSRSQSEFISLTGIESTGKTFKKLELSEVDPKLLDRFEKGSLKIQDRMKVLLTVSEEEKRLAERDAFPELRPRLVYAGTNDGGEFYGLGITIPLPFSNRNQNAIQEANAVKKSAQTTATYYRSETFRSQLQLLQQSISSSLRQLELYETKVIPSFQSALKAYNQQLRSGQGTVLQVWQVAVSLNESYERYTELWIKTFSERTELSIFLQEDF